MSKPLVLFGGSNVGGKNRAMPMSKLYPGRIGCLFGPGDIGNPLGLPYVLDNGRFTIWANGGEWDESKFIKHLNKAAKFDTDPRWVVVPDVVANPEQTFRWWEEWAPWLRDEYEWPLALAVQDGMVPEDIAGLSLQPDVIFVGGKHDVEVAVAVEMDELLPPGPLRAGQRSRFPLAGSPLRGGVE